MVVGGKATVNTSGSAMTVNQATDRAALNWSTFNIGTAASVQFVQPSASSVALNRVQSTSGSVIQGKLSANGQVFLLNPNGVLFSKDARVDLGGLVASTMDADPAAFMAGGAVRLSGSGAAGARVVNQGDISTRGYAVLLGQDVSNQGSISAQAGAVVLAAGSAATLTLGGDKLIQFAVDPAALQVAVDNAGRITTDERGIVTGPATDEVFMRLYIHHWKELMKASPSLSVKRTP